MSWFEYKFAYILLLAGTHSAYVWFVSNIQAEMIKKVVFGFGVFATALCLELVIYVLYDYLRGKGRIKSENNTFMILMSLVLQPINLLAAITTF